MSPISAEVARPGQIPRRNYNGKVAGPLLIPPDAVHQPGDHQCESCGRMVAPLIGKRGKPLKTGKGTCTCTYYRRCTTYIDVLQAEFALKQYDRRMVAYGMSQRPELVLAAAAADPRDTADTSSLQTIAAQAIDAAQAEAAATIGSALHKLTERLDNGETLGYVPEPYPADLRAYQKCISDAGIEWVAVESFRVHDGYKVAGTTDRIGWLNGKLYIFDLKTSPKENPISYPHGPSMQLAMYANSVPYVFPGDYRTTDIAPVDLDVAWIINLPAGSGRCELRPIDISRGWKACALAEKVWDWRDTKDLILKPEEFLSPESQVATRDSWYMDMVESATSNDELRALWNNARDNDCLTPELKKVIRSRDERIKETLNA